MSRPTEPTIPYESLILELRNNDPLNYQMGITALDFLAVSKRCLSIIELAWVAALGVTDGSMLDTVSDLEGRVDHSRLIELIDPFIAHVDPDNLQKQQVTLRNKSVKDFLLAGQSDGHRETTLQYGTMALHARALDICVRYLLLDDIGTRPLFSETEAALEMLPQEANLFDDTDDSEYDRNSTWEAFEKDMLHYNAAELGFGELFVYASCHWVDHYNAVSDCHLLPAADKIERLCAKSSMRLDNWITQNQRPGCTIQPRFEFDSSLYDPLSITALYGSEAAFQHMLDTSDLESAAFHPNTVFRAVQQLLQWGDLSRLLLLMRSTAGEVLRSFEFFHLVIRHWCNNFPHRNRHWDVAADLVEEAANAMAKEQWGYELLRMACDARCFPVFEALVESAESRPMLKERLMGAVRPV